MAGTRHMYRQSYSKRDGGIGSCPECGGRIVSECEVVCRDCGVVLDASPTDRRPRRTRPQARDGGRATGAPLTPVHANRRLSSYIGRRRDARGSPVSPRARRQLERQRTQQRRAARGANKQTLQPGLAEIARVCAAVEATTTVRESASVLFRQALAENLLYGRAYESIAGATVYLGARRARFVRTLTEVANASRCPNNSVRRDVRFLQRELAIAAGPISPVAYLPRLQSTLGVDDRLLRQARQLLGVVTERNLHSGRDPKGVAAGAVYTVARLEGGKTMLSQREVATAADVTTETVRTRFDEFEPLCPDVNDKDETRTPSSTGAHGSGDTQTADGD